MTHEQRNELHGLLQLTTDPDWQNANSSATSVDTLVELMGDVYCKSVDHGQPNIMARNLIKGTVVAASPPQQVRDG